MMHDTCMIQDTNLPQFYNNVVNDLMTHVVTWCIQAGSADLTHSTGSHDLDRLMIPAGS